MSENFAGLVGKLVAVAPDEWIEHVCEGLKNVPLQASRKDATQAIPQTNNPDLSTLMGEVLRVASGHMSWEALAWALETTHVNYKRWKSNHEIEFLWAGPAPANQVPARRIDQALYDLIAEAKEDILLVTFAAAKIERLSSELLVAVERGVRVRLILEFEASSEGQLSFDALKAFLPALRNKAEVYCWPVEHRERNKAGRPGKLHAKMAIIDDFVLVSSANLTDDAFNRNLEVGAKIRDPEYLRSARSHFESLLKNEVLEQI